MIELRWKVTADIYGPGAVCVGSTPGRGAMVVLQYRESAVAYDEEGRADYAMGWSDWTDVEISDE